MAFLAMYSEEIRNLLGRDRRFFSLKSRWVCAKDQLFDAIIAKPGMAIVNSLPSCKLQGGHWTCLYFLEETCYFFDPLGKNLEDYGREMLDFAYANSSQVISVAETRIQSLEKGLCGEWCLFFAIKMSRGMVNCHSLRGISEWQMRRIVNNSIL